MDCKLNRSNLAYENVKKTEKQNTQNVQKHAKQKLNKIKKKSQQGRTKKKHKNKMVMCVSVVDSIGYR